MKKTTVLFLALISLAALLMAGCMPSADPEVAVAAVSSSHVIESPKEESPVTKAPADINNCNTLPVATYPTASLSDLVKSATGSYPAMINSCFGIFNLTHGNRTNWLYVKNGWALLNLPVEVFVPWAGDTFSVGDPASVAKVAVIDEDTIIVDGGVDNYWQDGNLIKKVDWSTVKGGIYINEVLFESDRLKTDSNNQRFWTAWCDGKEFDNAHLQEALACGRGE